MEKKITFAISNEDKIRLDGMARKFRLGRATLCRFLIMKELQEKILPEDLIREKKFSHDVSREGQNSQ